MVRLSGRIKDLERVFTTRALDHAGAREIYSAQPMLQDGRAALNKTRIFGSSHWLNIAYQVCCGYYPTMDVFTNANSLAVFRDARLFRCPS